MSRIANSMAPWALGPGGVTNFTRHQGQTFARQLLTSQTYRDELQKKIASGTLPPAVEIMLWAYAYGKPPEHIHLSVSPEDLSALSVSELLQRAEALRAQLEEAEEIAKAIDAEVTQVA